MEQEMVNTFDYVNLNEIDPAQQLIPEGVYTLKLLKIELKEGVSKKDGNPYQRVDVAFAVQDDDNFSGRRVWVSLFEGESTLKQLRKLMDATGVAQTPGSPLTEWFQELSTIQPTVKGEIKHRLDIDKNGNALTTDFKGNPTTLAKLNMWSIIPV